MLVRRLGVGTLSFLAVLSIFVAPVSPDTGDKQLARVKGVVGYQIGPDGDFKAIFGRLDLPNDAFAVTKPNGAAVLRLKDSSEIDIGENTKVQIGQFNAISSGNQNTINLQNGALHFNIRHPQGGQSNYKFVTATSQIAVRGTEGFLIAGAQGTQVVCVSCAVGDVTVQVGQQTVSIVSGQTLTVLGTSPLTATSTITANPTVNNPAINQFNNNANPFSSTPTGTTVDPTASLSGTGSGAAGASIGTIAAVGGGAATVGAVVVSTNTKNNASPEPTAQPTNPPTPQPSASPAPTPTPTSAPTSSPIPTPTPTQPPGPLVLQVSFPGANAAFPVPFNWPFSQTFATTQATATCAPSNVITCTVAQAVSGTTLQGAINGTLNAPGTFTVSASASGYTVPTTSFTVYGAVEAKPSSLSFTSVTPQTLALAQGPAGAALTTSVSCNPGASLIITPSSGPSPLNVTVTPVSAPTTGGASSACTITISGQGGTTASTTSVPVNITLTSIGISSKTRKKL